MGLNYQNLDARTRSLMSAELAADQHAGQLYMSPRLDEQGKHIWAGLLDEAVAAHDDVWLAAEIRNRNLLKLHEERHKPKGGTTSARVPANAHETLAEGEFNRFYVRALCLRAVQDGINEVTVYRARHSENPRAESEAMIGRIFNAETLLNDLRASVGVEPALGVPVPNSGLSVRLP